MTCRHSRTTKLTVAKAIGPFGHSCSTPTIRCSCERGRAARRAGGLVQSRRGVPHLAAALERRGRIAVLEEDGIVLRRGAARIPVAAIDDATDHDGRRRAAQRCQRARGDSCGLVPGCRCRGDPSRTRPFWSRQHRQSRSGEPVRLEGCAHPRRLRAQPARHGRPESRCPGDSVPAGDWCCWGRPAIATMIPIRGLARSAWSMRPDRVVLKETGCLSSRSRTRRDPPADGRRVRGARRAGGRGEHCPVTNSPRVGTR